jgi:hypothetical protein
MIGEAIMNHMTAIFQRPKPTVSYVNQIKLFRLANYTSRTSCQKDILLLERPTDLTRSK